MGQASRRGTFEYRKKQAIAKRNERQRVDREAWLQRQAERDAELDRQDRARETARSEGRPIGHIGTGGFGGRVRRGTLIQMIAAILAATGSGVHPQAVSDARFR